MTRYHIQSTEELEKAGRKVTRFQLLRETPPMRGMAPAGTFEVDGWGLTDAEILFACGYTQNLGSWGVTVNVRMASGGAYQTNRVRGQTGSCTHSEVTAVSRLASKLFGKRWRMDCIKRYKTGEAGNLHSTWRISGGAYHG